MTSYAIPVYRESMTRKRSENAKAPAKSTPVRGGSAAGARSGKSNAKTKTAKESKTKGEESSREGRPTKYNADLHPALAEAWAFAGLIDTQIAERLGVAESTLYLWKSEHVEFSEALKRGKSGPDDKVEACLFARATGYDHPAVKIFMPANAIKPVYAEYIEHTVPDVTAQIFWLKNRRPSAWKDKQEVAVSDPEGILTLTPAERAARIAEILAKAAQA